MEAKLYVLFACTYFLLTGRRSWIAVGMLIAVAYAGLLFNPEFARYSAIWLTGCGAYYFWECKSGSKQKYKFGLSLGVALLIVMADLVGGSVLVQDSVVETRGVWIDVAIVSAFSWVLFRLKLRIMFGKRLADYSYTLYATHFPVLILFQSLLVSSGSTSISVAVAISLLGGAFALGIARIGGNLEAAKDKIQLLLLASWVYVGARVRGAK